MSGSPLPPRAKLSLQPLISMVCVANAILFVVLPGWPDADKVGEAGNGLKYFLRNAAPICGCAGYTARDAPVQDGRMAL